MKGGGTFEIDARLESGGTIAVPMAYTRIFMTSAASTPRTRSSIRKIRTAGFRGSVRRMQPDV